jgi:hypothetical protein
MPTTPNFSQPAIFSEVSTPTAPDSGYLKVYGKAGVLCSIANSGSEQTYLTAANGSVTNDMLAGSIDLSKLTITGTPDGTKFLRDDGSWQAASGGSGLTSLNGLTGGTQTFSVGTSGTDFAISSSGTAHTFNLPDAGASARGLVTTGAQTFAGAKTFAGDLLFTDATYDIGKSGATRPRDGFFSRNLNVSGRINCGGTGSNIVYGFTSGGLAGISGYNNGVALLAGNNWTFYVTSSDVRVDANLPFGWSSVGGDSTASLDTILRRDAAGVIHQRNGTNVQTFRLANTWTSSTSFELLQQRGVAGANFEFGPMKGSAGGTLRGLTIGGYATESASITPWLTFTNTGAATFSSSIASTTVNTSGDIFGGGSLWSSPIATHAGWRIRRANGTSGSPTQLVNNDLIGFISAIGYHSGEAYQGSHSTLISFLATESFTSTACGGMMRFATTANGTTTNTTRLTIENSGVIHYARLMGQTNAEITSTPSGTTQTITLNDGNHQTLRLTSATGTVAVTLTVPSNVSSGTIIVIQHASTPRNITWAVSSGTVRWMGTQPTWSSDAVNAVRIVSWRYTGSVMYLMSTDVAA